MTEPIPITQNRRIADQRRISWLFSIICVLFAINCAVLFVPPLHLPRIFHALLVILLVAVCVLDRRGITQQQLLNLLAIATAIFGISLYYAAHTPRMALMLPVFLLLLLCTFGGIYFIRFRKPTYVTRSGS